MKINKTREEMVDEFVSLANPERNDVDLYLTCLAEEIEEFIEAVTLYELEQTATTRENLVKEMADVQYTLSQLALGYRVDLQSCFELVHKSNMSKLENGSVLRRSDGKILKGKHYQAPNLKGF